MGLYFLINAALVFIEIAAFALFIGAFGVPLLPYAYLVTAVGAALAGLAYLWTGARAGFHPLLTGTLAVLIAICLIYWAGVTLGGAIAALVVFSLPMLFRVVTNLGNMVFWAITGGLMTVRQGKRLFGIISAGGWVATILGGFASAPLIGWWGLPGLLLLAALSLFAALPLLRHILRTCTPPQTRPHAEAPAATRNLIRSRYVLLIFGFLFVWWLGFNIVHNIFSGYAARQYPDANALGAFLGAFASVSGALALLINLFATAPVVKRYGLWGGLLIMPLVVTGLLVALATGSGLGLTTVALFGLAAASKLLNVGLGFGLDQPAHTVLYSPLPLRLVGRIAGTAEGVVQPLAVGGAGLLLLIFDALARAADPLAGMAVAGVAVGAAWLAITAGLVRAYQRAVADALTRRQLGDSARLPVEHISAQLLDGYLRDPHPGAVLYALDLLEQRDQPPSVPALRALLQHPAADVRRAAFAYIERRALKPMLADVRVRLNNEQAPEVIDAGLRALAVVSDNVIADLRPRLISADPIQQCGALAGLLRHGGIDGVLLAGQVFNQLLHSAQAAERQRAAEVIGDVGLLQFHHPIKALLQDSSPAVRQQALRAAGRVSHPELWPAVVAACDDSRTRREAIAALAQGGTSAQAAIATALAPPLAAKPPIAVRVALIDALGRIGQRASDALVRDLLHAELATATGVTRNAVITALTRCGYVAGDATQRQTVREQIARELSGAALLSASLIDLRPAAVGEPRIALLVEALDEGLRHTRDRLLQLLAFLHDARAISSARQALNMLDIAGEDAKLRAYAIEVVDTRLNAADRDSVLALIESDTDARRLNRLNPAESHPPLGVQQRLRALGASDDAQIGAWTKLCALYACGSLDRGAAAQAIPAEAQRMLTIVERVIILKTVSVFAQTPGDVLADVAALLEEVAVDAGAAVFHKGDPGDSLYMIVEGAVQVRDGEQVIRELGARDVFGEMALLDNAPRSASIIAVRPTQLLRLAQPAFYDLLMDRPEIASGVIRVLAGYVRNLNEQLATAQRALGEAHPPA